LAHPLKDDFAADQSLPRTWQTDWRPAKNYPENLESSSFLKNDCDGHTLNVGKSAEISHIPDGSEIMS
jgi:hypothetical protein